jgi:[acyl-carrier-protein] S-malonyltransferase
MLRYRRSRGIIEISALRVAMNPNSIAFLFPGQGSQAVGMGRELAERYPTARRIFQEADEVLGYELSQVCFAGPDAKLRLTEITQPAILTVSVALFRVLEEKGARPGFLAGHSLGEYSAHVAAGTMSFADALRAVRKRGKYMQEAVPVGEGAMAAIVGMELERVIGVCADAAQGEVCQPANVNSPQQVVISGHTGAVERAKALAQKRGAMAKILPVSAPFHCALMKPAQDRLAGDLCTLTFRAPSSPVISNVDADIVRSGDQARDALIRQVTGSVKWEQSVRLLIAMQVEIFVEVGPGKVLCGLMRQIDRRPISLSTGDESSLQKTLSHFALNNPV